MLRESNRLMPVAVSDLGGLLCWKGSPGLLLFACSGLRWFELTTGFCEVVQLAMRTFSCVVLNHDRRG